MASSSDHSPIHPRGTADGPKSAKAPSKPICIVQTHWGRLEQYREAERREKERKPVDMDEYMRAVQELSAEFPHLDPVKDVRLLEKEVERKLADHTEEIERLRAVGAKLDKFIQGFMPEELDRDATQARIRTRAQVLADQALADKTRLAELEKQRKDLQDQVARLDA
jgi:hypothetical protein